MNKYKNIKSTLLTAALAVTAACGTDGGETLSESQDALLVNQPTSRMITVYDEEQVIAEFESLGGYIQWLDDSKAPEDDLNHLRVHIQVRHRQMLRDLTRYEEQLQGALIRDEFFQQILVQQMRDLGIIDPSGVMANAGVYSVGWKVLKALAQAMAGEDNRFGDDDEDGIINANDDDYEGTLWSAGHIEVSGGGSNSTIRTMGQNGKFLPMLSPDFSTIDAFVLTNAENASVMISMSELTTADYMALTNVMNRYGITP